MSGLLVEELRIGVPGRGNVVEQAHQVLLHGDARRRRIMRLDRGKDRLVLTDHLAHAARHRQGQAAIAIDMDLDVQDQAPDAGITSNLGDGRMESFVGLVKSSGVPATGSILPVGIFPAPTGV